MKKEERRAFVSQFGPDAIKQYELHEAEGAYERCPKTDWCAKYQEEKKKQEREQVETLQQRNQLLETVARQQEERLKRAEERMEKMASLISQLISSK